MATESLAEAKDIGVNFHDYDLCSGNASSSISEIGDNICGNSHFSGIYLVIFCLANMLMGLGTTPLSSLGAAYLDENVSPKNSPIYIGIWFAMMIMGPSVGLATASGFLQEFTDVEQVSRFIFVCSQISHSFPVINSRSLVETNIHLLAFN